MAPVVSNRKSEWTIRLLTVTAAGDQYRREHLSTIVLKSPRPTTTGQLLIRFLDLRGTLRFPGRAQRNIELVLILWENRRSKHIMLQSTLTTGFADKIPPDDFHRCVHDVDKILPSVLTLAVALAYLDFFPSHSKIAIFVIHPNNDNCMSINFSLQFEHSCVSYGTLILV